MQFLASLLTNLPYINPIPLAGWLVWFGFAGLLAESLQESMVKSYSEKTFSADDFQYLAIVLPPELIESPENFSLDNAVILAYAVAYLCSPDDGQSLDERQNFVIQILSFYKDAMGQAAGQQG